MTTQQLQGLEDANRAAMANMSPRYRRLDNLERWATGTQYKGRPNWWSDEVPLWEREPCIVYPVVDLATSSNTDLCLGESRFPRFSVKSATGEDGAQSKTAATTDPVDAFLAQYHKLSRFPTVCREAFTAAQISGTTVALHGARKGKPFVELYPAKWCTATRDADDEIEQLTIEYPYLEERQQPDGSWVVTAMLYRRVIDRESDTVYVPQKADLDGRQPKNWTADEKKSTKHALGFVPVVWYAFMRGAQPVNVIDGKAIHQWITDEIQAHDIARSQWHRGALMSEPQVYEIGVEAGYNPTATGRTAMVPTTEHGGPVTPDNPITGHFVAGPVSREARKRGPGYVWQYPTDAEVGVVNYPGDALKAQQDNCSDLRIKIQEAMCVVFLDPENIKFAATTSGKALEAIKAKQLDRCGQYREDFRDGFLIPCVEMQLRLARKLGAALKVAGLKEAVAKLATEESEAPADVEVVYGSFYKPDPEEQSKILDMIAKAVSDGLLDIDTAIERAAAIWGIQDVTGLKERIERDRIKRREDEVATLKRWSATDGGKPVSGDPPKPPKGGGGGRTKDGEVDAGQAGE